MIPVISVVGWSNTGKTTLICKLIPELKKRGYKTATIKHHGKSFEIDRPGKDTWLHRQAGAVISAISSPERFALVRELEEERPLEEIIKDIRGVDLIITEGYKFGDKPKLEVFRKEAAKKMELISSPPELFAAATDYTFPLPEVSQFDLEDVVGMVNLIEHRFLKTD